MHVLTYEAHNVLGVSDVKFDLEGHHLFIVGGKNEQGKSSALNALLMALCGRSGMDGYPDVPLKQGEDKGWVKVNLSGDQDLHDLQGFQVELLFRRNRAGAIIEEFRILDSAGEEAPEPRRLLKTMFELKGFDPLAFERLDRKGKKALLEKLLDLDFTPYREATKKLYDERTAVNRDEKRLKAQVDALPHHKDAPAVEVVTADLLKELEARQATNLANKKARNELDMREMLVKQGTDQVALREKQMADLQKLLERVRAELADQTKKAEEQRATVAALVDADETTVRQQIASADVENRKVRENAAKRTALKQLEAVRKQSEELTNSIQVIADTQNKALQDAPWPVPGLAIDEEGVLFNGLPFEQASRSKRTLASFRIGMALNPKMRLLICQGGSELDLETLEDLGRLAKEQDFQIILELMTRTAADENMCAVVIKGGAVVGAEVPAEDDDTIDESGEPEESDEDDFLNAT